MKVSVAAFAPPTPPDTGASSVAMPRPAASACALRALATSMVEQSMNSVPCRASGTISFHTDSTCSPAGSMVTTTSAFSTVALALPTICTPSFAGGVARRRHDVEARHVSARFDQIGGHRPAHIAETDEANMRHGRLLDA